MLGTGVVWLWGSLAGCGGLAMRLREEKVHGVSKCGVENPKRRKLPQRTQRHRGRQTTHFCANLIGSPRRNELILADWEICATWAALFERARRVLIRRIRARRRVGCRLRLRGIRRLCLRSCG